MMKAPTAEASKELWERRKYAFKWVASEDDEDDLLDEISQTILISHEEEE